LEVESAERMAIRIVVAGEIFLDQILSGFSEWPQKGQEAFATSMVREVGGGAAHTAMGLARLGWVVALTGPIGQIDGAWVRDRLRSLGLQPTHLKEVEGESTGTTIAISSPEDRTFFTYPGANKSLRVMLAQLPSGDHLHLACPCDSAILERLTQQFTSVSIDAGWHADWLRSVGVQNALQKVTWFLPNEREAAFMTGESEPASMLNRFFEMHINAAIKLGPNGSAIREENGNMLLVPSIPVQVIDTTGAGDNFDAGFLDAWLRGKTPQTCLRAGNILGALSTRTLGGMNGFPTTEEFESWVSK
jgi:ribokinase